MKQIKFTEIYVKEKCYDLIIDFDWKYCGYQDIDEVVGFQHIYEITELILVSVREYIEGTDDIKECILLTKEERSYIKNWLIDELLSNRELYGIVKPEIDKYDCEPTKDI